MVLGQRSVRTISRRNEL